MQTAMKKFLLFAIPLLVVAGCAKELEVKTMPQETVAEKPAVEEVPQVTVIHAGFENPETKSHLQLNTAGTVAKVLWNEGDVIKLTGMLSNGSYYSQDFTTSQDEVTSADFSCSDWNPSNQVVRYYGFYPAGSFLNFTMVNSVQGLGVLIPAEQTAVPGNIAEGLNLAYASATSLSGTFSFRNIPALIKFRLSGDIVDEIASVNFTADVDIAGGGLLMNIDGDTPSFDLKHWISGSTAPTSTVILNKPADGSFETDTDYYIAVYPASVGHFRMVFMNAEGEYVSKSSSNPLTLERSRIVDFGTINVGNSFKDPLVTKYLPVGSGVNPVDIVVIPDGFTKDQRETFENRAAAGIDFLFETEPYKSFKDYFNVYFIWASSKEEGASITDGNGNVVTQRNTAFGSRWGEDSYDDMTADGDKVFDYVSAHCPEIVKGKLSIDEVPVLILVNDIRYGGKAHTFSSGRSFCLVPYTFEGGEISWGYPQLVPMYDEPLSGDLNSYIRNRDDSDLEEVGGTNIGDWRNTMLHEYGGHSFGRLADEYWGDGWISAQSAIDDHSWRVPFALNVSGYYADDKLPATWQELLGEIDFLTSRNELYRRIGKFQGGDVSMFNRWRSEKISCMIDNRQYFSTLQRVLIAKRIMELAGEEFDLHSYLLKIDDPTDPKRDGGRKNTVNTTGPIKVMPPLAPPERIDNTSDVAR